VLCSHVSVQIVFPRESVTSFTGELASFVRTIQRRKAFNSFRVYVFAVTVKVLPELEGFVACAHSAPEWSGMFLKMLVQEMPLGKYLQTFFALELSRNWLSGSGRAGSVRKRAGCLGSIIAMLKMLKRAAENRRILQNTRCCWPECSLNSTVLSSRRSDTRRLPLP